MTTTKAIYVAALILPFGFVVLAAAMLIHAAYKRRQTANAIAQAAR